MQLNIETIQRVQKLLNVAELARRSGIKDQTLFAKIRRGSKLKPAEAKAIAHVFREAGISIAQDDPS